MKQNVLSTAVGFGFLITCSLNVHAGQDQKAAFVTPADSNTLVDFGAGEFPVPPADFYDPGSDPFDSVVEFQGAANPATPCDTDLLVGEVVCPGSGFPRACDPVAVEIVALDLVSSSPATVTYNGGMNPEFWVVGQFESVLSSKPMISSTVH